MKKILFVTHLKKQCGVYQFGQEIFEALKASSNYDFIKVECESLKELKEAISIIKPVLIIYNYHPTVMPWLCYKSFKGIYKNNVFDIKIKQIGIIHEITQTVADTATAYRNRFIIGRPSKIINSLFDYYIAADPTLLLKNPIVFKTGRLIKEFTSVLKEDKISIPVIGSFGFGTPNKGFQKLIERVQNEFDEAIIKINMPFAAFGDKNGDCAKTIANKCFKIVNKKNIQLEINHDFLEPQALLKFLSGNDLNVFLYEDKMGRGISSAVDNALAVHKPIAVSNCPMFRHILNIQPSICIENSSLKEIMNNGFTPLAHTLEMWNDKNMLWEYERILDTILETKNDYSKKTISFFKTIKNLFRRKLSIPDQSFTWLRDTSPLNTDYLIVDKSLKYTSIQLGEGEKFNRILDDTARLIFKPAVDKLFEAVPSTMAKKIDRANVQQGFVFDTVFKFAEKIQHPKMLCVGCYEDTASMTLIKMGHNVEEIDPMINYFLQDFFTKPSTIVNSYDIIFSTSVIEHDPNDKTFMECIEGLLVPGGVGVITCDYKDGWVKGEPKPDMDERFYTKKDMEQRLLSYIPKCDLIDDGEWDCANPDFNFINKYQYTFATFVFRKKMI